MARGTAAHQGGHTAGVATVVVVEDEAAIADAVAARLRNEGSRSRWPVTGRRRWRWSSGCGPTW